MDTSNSKKREVQSKDSTYQQIKRFKNGFSFVISSRTVQIILGIPSGQKPVILKTSKEASEIIHGTVHRESPSVGYLCSLLSDEGDELAFSHIFMLTALAAFISPNGRGVTSCRYYQAIIDFIASPDHDWCSFTLHWLILYIKKFQRDKREGLLIEAGGCKIIPVRKHISSTPFRETGQDVKFKMPYEVQEYIDIKFQGISYMQPESVEGALGDGNDSDEDYRVDQRKSMSRVIKDHTPMVITKTRMPDIEALSMKLFSMDRLEFIDGNKKMIDQLMKGLMISCTLEDQDRELDLPQIDGLYEEMVYPKFHTIPATLHSDKSSEFADFVKSTLQKFSAHERQIDFFKFIEMRNQKFSMSSFNFLPPGENIKGNELSNDGIHHILTRQVSGSNLFMFSNKSSNASMLTPVSTNLCHEGVYSPDLTEAVEDTCRGNYLGLSLNERVLGKRIATTINEGSQPEFPSFSTLDIDISSVDPLAVSAPQGATTHNHFLGSSSKTKIIDPYFDLAMDQWEKQLAEDERRNNQSSKLFVTADELGMKQTIYANSFEHDFYLTLTTNTSTSEYSPRIFEVNRVWVDQRKLILSMRPGGWTHPHTMDCFGMLIIEDQFQRDVEGTSKKTNIMKHVFVKDFTKILTDASVNHNDPQYTGLFSTNNVGFKLENAGLVHVPVVADKQWILIVANFIDGFFDVLNPDSCFDKFINITHTVVHNFKIFFQKEYPRCLYFKIHEFKIRHVQVPKHNFRYDSGIFVIKYMLSYNGIVVVPFSNEDIQAIREKLTCQLVLSRHNEKQVPFVKNFLATHCNIW
ncbi:hypothetical protein ACQ4PT_028283 [Festuca glaucescens]